MATALEHITRALRTIGELPAGRTAEGAYAEDMRLILNEMLAQWSLEDLLLYYEKTEEFDLVVNQEAYTIGSTGADFTAVRPIEILAAQLRVAGLDYDLALVSNDSYQHITQKETTGTYPRIVCYNQNYPLGEIKVWPTPVDALKLRLSSNKQFIEVADLSDEISLPPGYGEAIVYGLAERAAIEAGRMDIYPVVFSKMEEAKANIKRKNVRMDLMQFDPRLISRRRGTYNPYSDT